MIADGDLVQLLHAAGSDTKNGVFHALEGLRGMHEHELLSLVLQPEYFGRECHVLVHVSTATVLAGRILVPAPIPLGSRAAQTTAEALRPSSGHGGKPPTQLTRCCSHHPQQAPETREIKAAVRMKANAVLRPP